MDIDPDELENLADGADWVRKEAKENSTISRLILIGVVASNLRTPYFSRQPHASPEAIAIERAEDVVNALEKLKVFRYDLT